MLQYEAYEGEFNDFKQDVDDLLTECILLTGDINNAFKHSNFQEAKSFFDQLDKKLSEFYGRYKWDWEDMVEEGDKE